MFLVNLKNVPAWQSNLVEIRQLTPGALHVGSQVYQVRRFGRPYSEIRAEVTDFELNKRYATKTLTKPQVTMSFSLDPEDSGTPLRYKFVLLTSGIMRLFDPLFGRLIKKQRESDFETLKHLLDG